MTNSEKTPRHVAVIGGGISGLASAYYLRKAMPDLQVTVLEASARIGGVLHTQREDNYLIEHSADNFITNVPWAVDLCREIGLEQDLIPTNSSHRSAFVIHQGRLRKIPNGFVIMSPRKIWPVLSTPILSLRGKLRLAWEYFVRAKKDNRDESLASFATRRFGREVYERLIQPLVGGIYTADPKRLSLRATLPRFLEMELQYGSLIRGARQQMSTAEQSDKKSSGARYGMFVTLRGGMTSLVERLVEQLPTGSVQVDSPVRKIETGGERNWRITVEAENGQTQQIVADGIVLAAPAHAAAQIVKNVDGELSDELTAIEYAGCAIVVLAYRREKIAHPLDGFGFVVPLCEKRKILSGSFSSIKYPGRAPQDEVLFRVFIGGACQAELADLPEAELIEIAHRELSDLLSITADPKISHVIRWKNAMPQYHLGHLDRVDRIEQHAAALPCFALAGNAYRGVGVPLCVHSAQQAAQRVVTQLTGE